MDNGRIGMKTEGVIVPGFIQLPGYPSFYKGADQELAAKALLKKGSVVADSPSNIYRSKENFFHGRRAEYRFVCLALFFQK